MHVSQAGGLQLICFPATLACSPPQVGEAVRDVLEAGVMTHSTLTEGDTLQVGVLAWSCDVVCVVTMKLGAGAS